MAGDVRDAVSVATRRELLAAALELAEVCGEVVDSFASGGFEVGTKPDGSVVTTADVETEKAFRASVDARFPDMGVLGEELGPVRPEADFQWVIDPIDGTSEFARHLPVFGTTFGLFYQGEPLLGVIEHRRLGLRFHAAYGLGAFANDRTLVIDALDASLPRGAARLGLPSRASFAKREDEGELYHALIEAFPNFRVYHTCYVHACAASGGLDAALEWEVPMWDLAATRVLVEEAGGAYRCVRERSEQGPGRTYCVVFGRPGAVAEIEALLRPYLEGTRDAVS